MLQQSSLGGFFKPVQRSDYRMLKVQQTAVVFASVVTLGVAIVTGVMLASKFDTAPSIVIAAFVFLLLFSLVWLSEASTPKSVPQIAIPENHLLIAYKHTDAGMRLVALTPETIDRDFDSVASAVAIAFLPILPFTDEGENIRDTSALQLTALGQTQAVFLEFWLWAKVGETLSSEQIRLLLECSKEHLVGVVMANCKQNLQRAFDSGSPAKFLESSSQEALGKAMAHLSDVLQLKVNGFRVQALNPRPTPEAMTNAATTQASSGS
jgi:hypothetical protein